MNYSVVESYGEASVTLHSTKEDAMSFALSLVKENTERDEQEILEDLNQYNQYTEGDYSVYVAKTK
jgi:hypothetical protein